MQLSCHITTLVHAEIILSTGNSRACYLFSPYKKLKCKLYEIMEQRKGPGLKAPAPSASSKPRPPVQFLAGRRSRWTTQQAY
jgi:hypothetical protein